MENPKVAVGDFYHTANHANTTQVPCRPSVAALHDLDSCQVIVEELCLKSSGAVVPIMMISGQTIIAI